MEKYKQVEKRLRNLASYGFSGVLTPEVSKKLM